MNSRAIFLSLFLIFLHISSSFAISANYAIGQQYRYLYSVDVVSSGITAAHQAGKSASTMNSLVGSEMSIDAEFVISREKEDNFAMEVLALKSTTSNSSISDYAKEYYAEEMKRYPVYFEVDSTNGKIEDLKFHRKDPAWAVNIKRGMLSMLQARYRKGEDSYSAEEFDAAGHHESMYKVDILGDNLILQRSRNEGQNRATFTVDSKTGILTLAEFSDDHVKPIDSGSELKVQAFGSLKLLEVTSPLVPFPSVESFGGEYSEKSFAISEVEFDRYQSQSSFEPVAEDDRDFQEILKKLALIKQDGTKYAGLFAEVVEALRMDPRMIEPMADFLKNNEVYRELSADILVATARDDAFKIVTAEAESDDSLKVRVLTGLGYVSASKHMVNYVLKIAETGSSHAALALGSMIRHSIFHRRALHALWKMERWLLKADNDKTRILYLNAIGNAGKKSSIPTLKKFLDADYSEDVRAAAVFAFRHYKDELPSETMQLLASSLSQVNVPIFGMNSSAGRPRKTLYSRTDELLVAGNEKFGATVGYRLELYNPFANKKDETVAEAHTYTRIQLLGKSIEAFDASVQLEKLFKKPDLFGVFLLGQTLWYRCFDLVGNHCNNENPSEVNGNCEKKAGEIFAFHMQIFPFVVKIPLLYGIFVDFSFRLGMYFHFGVEGALCARPSQALAQINPGSGIDLSGRAGVDAFIARVGVELKSKLFYTDFPGSVTMSTKHLPVQICSLVKIHQNPVAASIEGYAVIRDKVVMCGEVPCGLTWGHGFKWSKEWPGFAKGIWEKDLTKKCLFVPIRPGKGQNFDEKTALVVQKV